MYGFRLGIYATTEGGVSVLADAAMRALHLSWSRELKVGTEMSSAICYEAPDIITSAHATCPLQWLAQVVLRTCSAQFKQRM